MDMDLKYQLRDKLDAIAPEYSMVELTHPSFVRYYGYHMQPLSATDAVDALNALLDAATGVRIEVEADGGRNGGGVVRRRARVARHRTLGGLRCKGESRRARPG